MVVGIKDMAKLFVISVIACCAVFVCALFLNYNMDIVKLKDAVPAGQMMVLYEALVLTGRVVAAICGGCLALTSVVVLLFYIKNYIDSHGKELGILKALGYSDLKVAKHFWVFGLSVFVGCAVGYLGAALYMPAFYEAQNEELFLEVSPEFHLTLAVLLVVLPTVFFILLSVLYAYFRMKRPVLRLLRDVREDKGKIGKRETKSESFLRDLRKDTLRSRKILVFFVGFSAFCFSAMTQMSMSMDDLASENFSWMILSIGLILAFMTLFLSLSSVVKANAKTIAMMKVFGYSERECGRALLGGYRPVSYVGFLLGTVYQYVLLKIMVTVVFAGYENIPEYGFDFQAFFLSLALFVPAYELILCAYSRRIGRLPVKEVMLEP